MDRLFLDANVLFSAAYRADTGLLRFWRLGGAMLCSSRYAIEEARINLEDDGQKRRLARLAGRLEIFEAGDAKLPPGIALPEKNLPILLAAIAAQATHLITGDVGHLGAYFEKRIAGVMIVTPAGYLKSR